MPFWTQLNRPLILASQSPRRRELLRRLGFRFSVRRPRLDDERAYIDRGDLRGSLAALSRLKADSVAVDSPGALVFGGDTIVIADNEILGKPSDTAEARCMIERLSGRSHEVLSGVTLLCREQSFCRSATARTRVRFRRLHPDEIEEYLSSAEYLDKAGAYGIQEGAMAFVSGISGCYYNVVGLPMAATIGCFKEYARSGGGADAAA